MTAVATEERVAFGREQILVREVGEGPPVLLINGIGAHTRMWGLMERTLTGFRVISFDAPGAGQSSTPCGVTSISRLAVLATEVLDHFGISRADVVGYSMGGIVLQQLCVDAPSRVRRAVLVSTTPGVGAVYGRTRDVLNVSTPVRFLSDRLYLRTVGSLLGGRARTDRDWVAEHLPVRLLHKPGLLGYSQQILALATWSGLGLLERIHHPVLVMVGDDDPLAPVANSMLMAHLLPDARLYVLPGEGHLMPLDENSATPGLIRDFLAAPDHTSASGWARGEVVSAADLDSALAGKRMQIQPLPWGAISTLVRRRRLGR
jgi:pimeloyl-ACP methyl ester carboxylesterase